MEISFFVQGVPVPKGSAKSFYNPKAKKIVTMQDNRDRQKPWSSLISHTAMEKGFSPIDNVPFKLTLQFIMPRPKNHFKTGRNAGVLRENAPSQHIVKPDMDKLLRCVKDALTGIVWADDCQVSRYGEMGKSYGHQPGVYITIQQLTQ